MRVPLRSIGCRFDKTDISNELIESCITGNRVTTSTKGVSKLFLYALLYALE